MRTANGRKIKYFIGDHSAGELENYLEATFPFGRLKQEEVDDLCLIMGQLEEMARSAEGAFQQCRKQHAEQLENYEAKLRREARHFKIIRNLFEFFSIIIYGVVFFWSRTKLGGLIWAIGAPVVIVVINHFIDSAYQKRIKILSSDELILETYNDCCVKEKRSLDVIPKRPEDIDRWIEQTDTIWAFVKSRNPYDEGVGI